MTHCVQTAYVASISEAIVFEHFNTILCICNQCGAQVVDIACSHDGRYLFSVGGQDLTVNMWRINTPYVSFNVHLFV